MDRSGSDAAAGSTGAPQGVPGHLGYRADIDGLRALAVLPIVLFHAGVPGFGGGFVGVDIFFVISGYLIAANIWRDLGERRFSLLAFYERRLRRIVPALIVMLAATTMAAWILVVPFDLAKYARSLGATVVFASNVYFYGSTLYFDIAADQKPLLHTWSLAVEEQFYIAFPLFLMLFARWKRPVVLAALTLIALASLALSVLFTASHPAALFYLPFGRAWEFLIGALIAIAPLPRPRGGLADGLGWLGIGLIVLAVTMFDRVMRFPGAAALVPCIGAALVIATGSGLPARLLGAFPLRAIGLVSYSLYLWHWPLLVFYRYVFGNEIGGAAIATILALSLVLAALSWRFVEQPWRRPGGAWTRPRLFGAALAAALVFIAASWALPRLDRHVARFPPAVDRLARGSTDRNPLLPACNRPPIARIDADDICRIGTPGAPPRFAVIGDSIADALVPGFDAAAIANGTAGYTVTFTGCRPMLGASAIDPTCPPSYEATARFLERHPEIRTVVLVGRWPTIFGDPRKTGDLADGMAMFDSETVTPSPAENARIFARSMARLTARLPGRRILITAFVPEQRMDVPRVLAMDALRGVPLRKGVTRAQHDARSAVGRAEIEAVAARPGFGLIDMSDIACTATECPLADAAGHPLYYDHDHPSRTAAILWRDAFMDATR